MRRTLVLLAALSCCLLTSPVRAQVSLTTLGTPYTQSFDTLPASGSATWTNNSTIPGWFHARTGTGTTIVANNGSSNAGNLYSYGTGTATDRALGSVGSGNAAIGNLFWGVRLQNNTGATITALDISYTGEQWRNSAAAAQTVAFSYLVGSPTVTGSLAEFQSAGVAVAALDFTSPITGGVAAALDGNLAANRVTLTFSIGGLSIPNGTEVMLRWSDPDHTGADHGLSIDDFAVTPQGGVVMPALNISDVTLAEGDPPGTTTFTFAVTLTAPAGPGGVTFDIATADGTAQDDNPGTEDEDYVAQSLTGQSIPMGSTGPYNFNVTVNRDTDPEPNETFFVDVTSIAGANAGDAQGQGTINNDDVAITPIHDIQGPGGSSPIVGASVTTRGIVTGRKSNGYYIQEPDASVDADPATSEGVFVFTSSAPPAAAAVGNEVQVTATVVEFVPPQDLLQPPLTELSSPTTVQLSTGNPLPAAIPLSATFPDPAGPVDQLERLEGMRVSVASLTVSGPTLGNVNEASATATSTGVFFGTVTGVPRPFREPGIQAPDPAPAGSSIPPIPRFDANPELLRVDSDGLTGAPIVDVGTGAVVTGLVGPLDYGFRHYTILPDPGAPPPGAAGGPASTSASEPTGKEFTVASYNLERFFDTVNDPGIGEPVLTPAAFDNRLNKASLGIRNHLGTPDILGVVEVENLTTLQALAARISADAIAASQPDPEYDAFLVEGNDVGGIDVGFLVKTATVDDSETPRVTVNEVVQENAGELFVNADSSTELLNDRPSLRLDAVVNHPNGASFPVTVIVNHLRSLNGVNSIEAGSSGWATVGDRVRAKRLKQAESLANLVQARQTADPAERIILVGDFNAFEFNDGLGDSMNVIGGTPPPDNETAVPGDGVDLVDPDLDNLVDTPPPPERYSFIFDGQAQNLDHVLVNQPLCSDTLGRRIEHPRINSDFPPLDRNDPNTPRRLSDHDPVVGYFAVPAFESGDYFTLTSCRAVDTRLGAPLQDGVPQAFALHGVCGIPAGATSVVVNATVVGSTGAGELTLHAGDAPPPAFSALPFSAGQTRGLFAIVSLSKDAAGEVVLLSSVAGSGTVHVLLDVMGYFE
jgi:predicted extracellular nuclease